MLPWRWNSKKTYRHIRNVFRHGRFVYLFLLCASGMLFIISAQQHLWLALPVWGITTALCYRKLTARPKNPFSSVSSYGNPFSDPGIFTYTLEGFHVASTTGTHYVAWQHIQALFGYKVDLYATDQIRLDIFYKDAYLGLHEELAGWHPFLRRLAEQFPTIKAGWEIGIATPPFATNLTLLYEKDGRDLEQAQALYYNQKEKT
jgi:hypothetical protein